jgi:hypothetical protein
MPRFYMHVCNGNGFVEDDEGVELPDEATARTKAIAAARDVMAGDMRKGELDLTSFIEVEDEAKQLLFTLTFADAVTITHRHSPPPAPPPAPGATPQDPRG